MVPGTKRPVKGVVAGAGPVHVPIGFGVPPNADNRFTLAPPAHKEMDDDVPAFGKAFSNTVTTETSGVHGDDPVRV